MIIPSFELQVLNFTNLALLDFFHYYSVDVVVDDRPSLKIVYNSPQDLQSTGIVALLPTNVVSSSLTGKITQTSSNQYSPTLLDTTLRAEASSQAEVILEKFPFQFTTQLPSVAWNAYSMVCLGWLWLFGRRIWNDPHTFWDDPLSQWF